MSEPVTLLSTEGDFARRSPGIWAEMSPLIAAALDDSHRGLLIFDPELRPVHVTSSAMRLLGVSEGFTWCQLDLSSFLSQADLDGSSLGSVESALLHARNDSAVEPVTLVSKDQKREIRMRVRNIGQMHLAATLTAASGRGAPETMAQSADTRDALTDLPTRVYFENAVNDAIAKRGDGNLAVLLMDLDRFKPVNDTLGHAAGDTVLRLVAQRLKSIVRETDCVARLGGDEFALLIHPLSPSADPADLARRIVDLVGRTYLIDGHLVNVGASVGIALGPRDGGKHDVLMRCADLALYHSKTTGRGTHHFFNAEMQDRAQARRTGELDLRRALALRQLEVHYQPQVDIETETLVGFEALIRWRHPERGMIPPNDFLPLAEEIGVIIPIGDWVLKTACREAMKWPDHIVIAVNASPIQFETGRFADTVKSALAGTKLPARRLEIEVTEGILLREEHAVLNTLSDLRAMGVRIAMDDFGTGHASLSQLARFSFDKIKIDRSLVGPDGDNSKHRAIVRAISALGSSLGVATMAEGIETTDQLERIRLDGCGSVQGYLFSKAVPAGELAKLMLDLAPGSGRTQHAMREKENELRPI